MKRVLIFCICAISCRQPLRVEKNKAKSDDSSKVKFSELPSITGDWILDGTDNVAFIIDRDSITYPDDVSSFAYNRTNDSIIIHYNKYEGRFAVGIKGKDTLILTDNDQQVYIRAKE
ncbi:MAG: hypothetical protein QM802_03470 [Agriterribacter sp.]